MTKYQGYPRLDIKELHRTQNEFTEKDFVFACDMTDLFGEWVPEKAIIEILTAISMSEAKYLLLTKNPKRYSEFTLPKNCVAGATIECDMNFQIAGCKAPTPYQRLEEMAKLKHPEKMVSIEPIMNYTQNFLYKLLAIKPDFVAVGYDNYDNKLAEPYLARTTGLIQCLEQEGIKVYRKTLREKWNDEVKKQR